MLVNGGYKTITITQLGNLLHALSARKITWLAARTWFAGLEMVAIREAASRCQRLRRGPRRKTMTSCFRRAELMALTGLTSRAVAQALKQLRESGLAEFSKVRISVGNVPLPEAHEFLQILSGGRSVNRPVPVPRPLLRFLARLPTAALGKVMLGYICRGLSIARSGGTISASGTVKASWLADALGLSERSVRYAQMELRSLGWIGKDTGSKQWKLNRHGAWFHISLGWTPVALSKAACNTGDVHLTCAPIAPPAPESCTPVAPPKEDRKTPSESKNQRTVPGVLKTEIKAGIKSTMANAVRPSTPDLRDIRLEDLCSQSRLQTLLGQAIAREWVRDCNADAQNFFAAAVRARTAANGDPVRIFVTLVRRRLWHHITQAQEDEARRTVQTDRQADYNGGRPNGTEPGQAGKILSSILQGLPALGRTTFPTRTHPGCGEGLMDNRRSSRAPWSGP